MTVTPALPTGALAAPATAARALPVLLLGNFLAVLDFFVVNVALPSIGTSFGASSSGLELVVAGYGVGYACTLIAGGRLGDLYGRRRLFVLGVAAFTVTSALCGVAPTMTALVLARVLQGVAAGKNVPKELAVIQASFHGSARERALGLFGAMLGTATVAGQLVGGAIVELDLLGLGWRPIFLVNVPLGIVGVVAALKLVPDSRPPAAARIDATGTALLAASVSLLLVPLALGREEGWPLWCVASIALAPLVAAAFVWTQARRERTGHAPLLPLSLLQYEATRRGLLAGLAMFTAAGGFFLPSALTLQGGRGLSPIESGLTMLPLALAFLAVSLAAAPLARRLGGRRSIVLGGAIMSIGFGLQALTAVLAYDDLGPLWLAVPMAVTGVGQGLVVVRLVNVVLSAIPAAVAGAASGVLTTTIQLSLATGAAVIGSTFAAIAADVGWRAATVTALAIEATLAAVTAVAASRLPERLAAA
jgi:EmrB/QacA subfamily drug resistance transporter